MPTLRDQIGILKEKYRDATPEVRDEKVRGAMGRAFDTDPADLVDYLDTDVSEIPKRLAEKKGRMEESGTGGYPLPPATPIADTAARVATGVKDIGTALTMPYKATAAAVEKKAPKVLPLIKGGVDTAVKELAKQRATAEAADLPSDTATGVTDISPDTSKMVQPVEVLPRLKGVAKGLLYSHTKPEDLFKEKTPLPKTLPADYWAVGTSSGATPQLGKLPGTALKETFAKGYKEAEEDTEKKLASESFPTRLLSSAKGAVMAVPKLVAMATEPYPVGTDEEKKGEEIGRAVAEGATGGSLYAATHPVESLQVDPIGTLGSLMPAAKSVTMAARAIKPVAKVIERVSDVAEKVNVLPTWYRKAFVGSTEQDTPRASGIVEELQTAGKGKMGTFEGDIPVTEPKGEGLELLATDAAVVKAPTPKTNALADLIRSAGADERKLGDIEVRRRTAETAMENAADLLEDARRAEGKALVANQRASMRGEVADDAALAAAKGAIAVAEEKLASAKLVHDKLAQSIPANKRVYFSSMRDDQLAAHNVVPVGEAPPPALANIFTKEQALKAATQMVTDAKGDPKHIPDIANKLQKYYAENPDAPLPRLQNILGGDARMTPLPTPPHRQARDLELETKRAAKEDIIDIARRQTPQGVAVAEKSLAKVGTGTDTLGNIADFSEAIDTSAREVLKDASRGELPTVLELTKPQLDLLKNRIAVDASYPAALKKNVVQHLEDMEVKDGVYVSKDAAAALDTRVPEADALRAVNSFIKESLTVRNPSSHVNNFVSNLAFKAAVTGNPITAVTELFSAAKALLRPNPEQAKALSFWNRTGLLDSNALGTDIAKITGEAPWGEKSFWGKVATAGRTIGRLGPVGKVAEKTYGMGDNIFKADKALTALNKYTGFYEQLEDGKWLDLEVSPNVKARLVGGSDTVELFAGNKVIKEIPLDEALYRAAARQAQNNYFDYSQVPGVAKWFRNSNALSILSPFTTWFLKAVDLPGKPGLLWRSTVGTSNEILGTNSARVAVDETGRMLGVAAQRSAYINGLKNALKEETNPQLQEAVAFAPTNAKLAIVRELADPKYLGVHNLGNWNYLQPTELLTRVATQAIGTAANMLDKRLPEEIAKTQRMSMLAGPDGERMYKTAMNDLYAELRVEDMKERKDEEAIAFIQQSIKNLSEDKMAMLKLSPAERTALKRNDEFQRRLATTGYATSGDALSLIQVAGTPVTDMYFNIKEASRMGKTLNTTKVVNDTLIPIFFGGLGKSVVKGVAEAIKRSDYSNDYTDQFATKAQEDKSLDENDWFRLMLRQITGVGWKQLAADRVTGSEATSFFTSAKQEWRKSLGTDETSREQVKREIEFHKKAGNTSRATELQTKLDSLKVMDKVIAEEMKLYEDNLKAVLTKTKKNPSK